MGYYSYRAAFYHRSSQAWLGRMYAAGSAHALSRFPYDDPYVASGVRQCPDQRSTESHECATLRVNIR